MINYGMKQNKDFIVGKTLAVIQNDWRYSNQVLNTVYDHYYRIQQTAFLFNTVAMTGIESC
ncbi:hypothetical protein O3M35_007240 [Rhynocoris fuscipes]|uniref:Uncharacterized protein n=1 Tax=Rhynocoris fuscipes TaxID=488301 RepID=A0AAW1DA21_9HEMI